METNVQQPLFAWMRLTRLAWLRSTRVIAIVLVFFGSHAFSQFRSYEAGFEDSAWDFSGNPVRCELHHDIPRYGKAMFFAKASRSPNLAFVLDSYRNPIASGKRVDVKALYPAWQPGKRAKSIDTVSIVPGEKTVNVMNEPAWKMLVSLENGQNPSFFYRDFADDSDRVSVGLSAINFQSPYNEFLQCVENLLPYDFHEIQYTMVHFTFNGTQLSQDDRTKLDVLAEFIKYDPDIQVVLVEGHTDSIARRRYNRSLGMKRAKSVKSYLTEKGIEPEKIKAISRGERRPLESNHTAEGRALNRRVFITLSKKG